MASGATLHRDARASHYRGLSCCGAQAPDAQAQQLWLTGPVAPRRVGSSQTRARTRVPCIGGQTLTHCATREAQQHVNFYMAPLKVFITENVIAYDFTSLIICVFLVLTKTQDLCQITDTQGN